MSTRLDKTIALTALAVGPATLIITNITQWMLQPTGPDPTATSAAAQFPTAWLVMGVLSVFGPLVWLAGLSAVADLVTGRGRAVTRIGALVTGAGLAAGIGHLAAFFGVYAAIAGAGLPAEGVSAMESAADAEPLGNILLVVFLVCSSLGPIVLTIGLRIAHRVGVWVPIAAALTAGANLFGGPVAGVVQLVALAAAWGAVIVAVARSPRVVRRGDTGSDAGGAAAVAHPAF